MKLSLCLASCLVLLACVAELGEARLRKALSKRVQSVHFRRSLLGATGGRTRRDTDDDEEEDEEWWNNTCADLNFPAEEFHFNTNSSIADMISKLMDLLNGSEELCDNCGDEKKICHILNAFSLAMEPFADNVVAHLTKMCEASATPDMCVHDEPLAEKCPEPHHNITHHFDFQLNSSVEHIADQMLHTLAQDFEECRANGSCNAQAITCLIENILNAAYDQVSKLVEDKSVGKCIEQKLDICSVIHSEDDGEDEYWSDVAGECWSLEYPEKEERMQRKDGICDAARLHTDLLKKCGEKNPKNLTDDQKWCLLWHADDEAYGAFEEAAGRQLDKQCDGNEHCDFDESQVSDCTSFYNNGPEINFEFENCTSAKEVGKALFKAMKKVSKYCKEENCEEGERTCRMTDALEKAGWAVWHVLITAADEACRAEGLETCSVLDYPSYNYFDDNFSTGSSYSSSDFFYSSSGSDSSYGYVYSSTESAESSSGSTGSSSGSTGSSSGSTGSSSGSTGSSSGSTGSSSGSTGSSSGSTGSNEGSTKHTTSESVEETTTETSDSTSTKRDSTASGSTEASTTGSPAKRAMVGIRGVALGREQMKRGQGEFVFQRRAPFRGTAPRRGLQARNKKPASGGMTAKRAFPTWARSMRH